MKRFSHTKLKHTSTNKTKEIIKLSAIALAITLGFVAITRIGQPVVHAEINNGLNASYFKNMTLSGEKQGLVVKSIDYDWDYSSPFTNNEPFSARWQGYVEPEFSENYTFTTFSDDGVRLWVDGKLLVDNWTDHPRMENSSTIKLTAGKKYSIKAEYYEHTERAVMKLFWQSASQSKEIIPSSSLFTSNVETSQIPPLGEVSGSQTSTGLVGKYFNGLDLTSLQTTRTDANVDFNWDYNPLGTNVNSDLISVRWQGQVMPRYSEEYTFHTISDDGIRLWVNNQMIINNWTDHPAIENTGKITLEANQKYNIRLEYYEKYGRATAKLQWSSNSQSREPIPSSHLFTSYSSIVQPTPEEPQPTPQPTAPTPTPTPTPTEPVVQVPTSPIVSPIVNTTTNPLAGLKLYANPYTQAQNWVNQNKQSNPTNAALIETIAKQPQATWLGGWNSNVYSDVQNEINAAASNGATPTFVVYNIPNRDCGQYSAGGASTGDSYKNWINSIASAIGSKKAIVVLEPDGLTLTSCLDASGKALRFELIKYAVNAFAVKDGIAVYIDAGHPKWVNSTDMAEFLKQAGIDKADGFALNTSNFISTAENISYGEKVSTLTGGKHFVIDTSRNGNGSNGEWCNPWGRRLGNTPSTNTGNKLVDAYLWVKRPGESDGNCNGGPSAGQFWPEYAISLVK